MAGTVTKKEQDARDDKAREMLTSKLYMSLSFNDWKRAAEAGIDKEDAETDEYVQTIMLAYKKTGKPFDELQELGLGELNLLVLGDLTPDAIKELI
jgi:hypothetical protein